MSLQSQRIEIQKQFAKTKRVHFVTKYFKLKNNVCVYMCIYRERGREGGREGGRDARTHARTHIYLYAYSK